MKQAESGLGQNSDPTAPNAWCCRLEDASISPRRRNLLLWFGTNGSTIGWSGSDECVWVKKSHCDMGMRQIWTSSYRNTMNRYESTFFLMIKIYGEPNNNQHISSLFNIDPLDFLTFHPCILLAILDHLAGETKVKRPKVGDEVPSEVRAEVRWSLTGMLPLGP